MLCGEVEIDESYLSGAARSNGDAALAARFRSSDCASGAVRSMR